MSEEPVPGLRQGIDLGIKGGKGIQVVFAILCVPAALLTQMLYRKEMGERYASPFRRAAAGLLVLGAGTASYFMRSESLLGAMGIVRAHAPAQTHPISTIAAAVWGAIFTFLSWEHMWRVRRRYATGARWHSQCSGVNRLPFLTDSAQTMLTCLLAFGLFYLRLDVLGLLMGLSAACGAALDSSAKRAFYESVLDVVDSQIEAETIGEAVRRKLSPAGAEGLQTHLPAYVSPQARNRIAEAFENRRVIKVSDASRSQTAATNARAEAVEAKPGEHATIR